MVRGMQTIKNRNSVIEMINRLLQIDWSEKVAFGLQSDNRGVSYMIYGSTLKAEETMKIACFSLSNVYVGSWCD